MSDMEYMFELIRGAAKTLRENNEKVDGKEEWGKIKTVLVNHLDIKAMQWVQINEDISSQIMKMDEFRIDGNGDKHINEINHFYIQIVRIPKTEDPTLLKVMQIAFNIGQIQGTMGIDEILDGFEKLEKYIDKTDIAAMNVKIPNELLAKINVVLQGI